MIKHKYLSAVPVISHGIKVLYQSITLDFARLLTADTTFCFSFQGRNGKGTIIVFSVGNGGQFNGSCSYDEYISSIHTLGISVVTGKNVPSTQNIHCAGISAVAYSRDGRLGINNPDDLMVRRLPWLLLSRLNTRPCLC